MDWTSLWTSSWAEPFHIAPEGAGALRCIPISTGAEAGAAVTDAREMDRMKHAEKIVKRIMVSV